MRMARMHSLKTPSRSTIRSCVRSSPSRCTFQYIQRLGAMVVFAGSFGPCRTTSASFSETRPFATSSVSFEPLHTCNLTCTGCGRIREYSTSLKDILPLEECLGAARECNAPMVSICGGEPLIYPQIEALVNGLLDQKRIVYICTNAMFMRK